MRRGKEREYRKIHRGQKMRGEERKRGKVSKREESDTGKTGEEERQSRGPQTYPNPQLHPHLLLFFPDYFFISSTIL